MNAKHARDGRAGDVRVKHADAVAHAAEHDGQLAGDEGLAHAAFAADLANLRRLFFDFLGGLIMIVAASGARGFGAAYAGRAALLKIRHGKNSFRSGTNSDIIPLSGLCL